MQDKGRTGEIAGYWIDMARYVNIYKEKSVVISKAYYGDYAEWVCEHEYKVAIEMDDGRLRILPVMFEDYLKDCTADEYLKDVDDEKIRPIIPYDCAARDTIIKNNITQWITNQGALDACSLTEAICTVVSLLSRNGMWKKEYAKSIDVDRIKREWGEK